jgi:hypothetical protein
MSKPIIFCYWCGAKLNDGERQHQQKSSPWMLCGLCAEVAARGGPGGLSRRRVEAVVRDVK